MTRTRLLLPALLLLVAVVSGCGDDAASTTTETGPATTAAPSTSAATTTVPATTSTTAAPTTTTTGATTTTTAPLPWETHTVEATMRCVVEHRPGDALNVRAGPSIDYDVIGTLAPDAAGFVSTGLAATDEQDREWMEVHDGVITGWVAGWLITPRPCTISDPIQFCVTDTACTDRLNVRSGPGVDYGRVGSLAHDAVGVQATSWVSTDDQDRIWVQIEWDGGVAWTAGWFLTTAPCSAATPPCSCGVGTGGFAMLHDVDPIGRFLEFDLITWVWVGPSDTEYVWENTDIEVVRLPIANGADVLACPPTDPLYCNPPDPFVAYPLSDLEQWIVNGTEIGQNQRYAGEIPGHTGQLWSVTVDNCSVTEISGIWFP